MSSKSFHPFSIHAPSSAVFPHSVPVGAFNPLDPFVTAVFSHAGYVDSTMLDPKQPQFHVIRLRGLEEGALELNGHLAHVSGRVALGGNFRRLFFQRAATMTSEGYAQVHLYHTLDTLLRDLTGLGFPIEEIIASRHRNQQHPIRARANAMEVLNAFFSRQDEGLYFGTGQGKFSLASSGDVVVHEMGHALLHHINPQIGTTDGDDGGAIHEGFGDALATLYYNDSQLAEEFIVALGKVPDPFKGMREVANPLTLDEVGDEVHDRGRVYGAYFWSLKERMADLQGDMKLEQRAAANEALKILVMHGFFYRTTRPTPRDFVDAILGGVEQLGKQNMLVATAAAVKGAVLEEAVARKMLTKAEAKARRTSGVVEILAEPLTHDGQSRYAPSHTVPFPGGRTEYHQQQLYVGGYGYVDLRGGMMIRRYSDEGKLIDSSLLGAWGKPQVPDISHLAAVTMMPYREALARALDIARVRNASAGQQLQRLNSEDPFERAPYAMELIRAERSVKVLEVELLHVQNGTGEPPWLVIPWGASNMHYELRLGFEVCHIGGTTGVPTFTNDLFM